MNKNLTKKLKSYSLTAGSLAVVLPASANIVYTDLNPDTLLKGSAWTFEEYNLDLNGDSIFDYNLSLSFSSWSNTILHYDHNALCNPLGSNYLITTNSPYPYSFYQIPIALSGSNIIDSLANWDTESTLGIWARSIDCCSNWTSFTTKTNYYGNFLGQNDKYIGVKFNISGNNHYGWILVDVSSIADSLTVKSYAYNDVPDQLIKAGQTVGIEDQSLNNVSIYGFNNQIYISGTEGTATVFNLQGQRVHQSKLTGKTSISLDKGIYLVRVSTSGGDYRGAILSVTKKVYLK